jgi:hypothetical protein
MLAPVPAGRKLSGESREAVADGWSGRLTPALRRFRPVVRVARSSTMGSMNGPERRAQSVNRTSSAVPTTGDPDSRVVAGIRARKVYEQTFAIITTASNLVVAPIHDRMPAILEGDSLVLWLNPATRTNGLPSLLGPTRDDLLGCRAVSPAVNEREQ